MQKIEPQGCHERLTLPSHPSEDQIRFALAKRIEAAGLVPILERRILGGYLDIAIFNTPTPTSPESHCLAIVETKASSIHEYVSFKHRHLYAAFGVPVFLVCSPSDIEIFSRFHLPTLEADFHSRYASLSASSLPATTKAHLTRKQLEKAHRNAKSRERYSLRFRFPNLNFH